MVKLSVNALKFWGPIGGLADTDKCQAIDFTVFI